MDYISISLHWLKTYAIDTVGSLALWFVIFSTLTFLFPGKNSQPYLRRGLFVDIGFFVVRAVYLPAQAFLQSGFSYGRQAMPDFFNMQALPFWLQIIIALLLVDFLQYWTHRWTHGNMLWKYHSIHHSSKTIDWLSSARWHPVNDLLHITLTQSLVASLNFTPEAFAAAMFLSALNGPFVHANLDWTFGPLRYIFTSPIGHRWHHTSPEEGGSSNFAPFFSFYDVIFRTFSMPKDVPTNFGAKHDSVPENFIGQMLYPFRKKY